MQLIILYLFQRYPASGESFISCVIYSSILHGLSEKINLDLDMKKLMDSIAAFEIRLKFPGCICFNY